MLVMTTLGESANELIQKWGKSGYRYGFPDQYAAEFPVRPMNYDQSRIYSGVVGRHYPDAQTMRYHYMFDPNMYMQPGVPTGAGLGAAADGMTASTKVAIGVGVTALLLGAVALAHYQLTHEAHDPYARARTSKKYEPKWHRESGHAYRAGRRLRR